MLSRDYFRIEKCYHIDRNELLEPYYIQPAAVDLHVVSIELSIQHYREPTLDINGLHFRSQANNRLIA